MGKKLSSLGLGVSCFLTLMLTVFGVAAMFVRVLLPYERVKQALDRYSYTGGVEYFTAAYYDRVVFRSVLAGGFMCLCAVGIFVFRRFFIRRLSLFVIHFHENVCSIIGWLREPRDEEYPRIFIVLFWVILAVGVCLRLVYLRQPVHADEARTFTAYAMRPYYILFSDWTAPNNHIFHTALVRICYLIFGSSLIALRFPAFVFGILFLVVIYLYGRKCFGGATGLLLMAFCSASSAFVSYSTMGRGYSILFVCSYVLFLCAMALQAMPQNPIAWVGAGMVSVIGFMTIPTMLYSFAGTFIWLVVYAPCSMQKKQWWHRLLIFAVCVSIFVILAYIPAFIATDWMLIQDDATLTASRSWVNIWSTLPSWCMELYRTFFQTTNGYIMGFVGVFGVAGVLLDRAFRRVAPCFILFVILWGITLGVPLIIQRVIPYGRIYIVLLPVLVVVPLYGLVLWTTRFQWIKNKNRMVTLLCLFILAGGSYELFKNNPENIMQTGDQVRVAEGAVRYLARHAGDHDEIIAMCPSPGPMVFYADKYGLSPRIWDLLEYIPHMNEGHNNIWIVVNEEYGHTLNGYLEKMHAEGFLTRAVYVLQLDGGAIYMLKNMAITNVTSAYE